MGFLMLFIVLSTGSVFLSTFFKKRYEESIPITILSIIAWLYLFYIFDSLLIGFYLTIIISILMYIVSIYKIIRDKSYQEIVKLTFTPGFFCYIILWIIIYFLTKDSVVYLFDELRLWGAYPKLLYYNNNLQIDNTMLYKSMSMNTYLPGMPLLQYFFLKCIGTFKESYLYFTYCLLGISLLIPITKYIKWKKCYLIIPIILFIIFIPLVFYNNNFDGIYYYKSIFIDPIMGIATGYCFYLLFSNPYKTNLKKYNYVIALILVILLKENGIIFVLISLFFSIILELIYYKNKNYKKLKSYINIAIPIIIVITYIISWKVVLNSYNKTSEITSDITGKNVVSLILHPTSNQKAVLKDVIKKIDETPLIRSNFLNQNQFLTYKNIMIFYIFILIMIIILVPKKTRTKYFLVGCAVIAQGIAYLLSLSLLFVLNYNKVLCFERYNNTSMLAILVCFSLIIIKELLKYDNKNMKILLITLLPIFILMPLRTIGYIPPDGYNSKIGHEIKAKGDKYESYILSKIRPNGKKYKLLYLTPEQYPIIHHRLYFSLLDNKIMVKDSFNEEGYLLNYNTLEEWLSVIEKEKYDYIFVADFDNKMVNLADGLFEGGIQRETIYKVKKENNKIIFKKEGK